jgi:hypothetical protein
VARFSRIFEYMCVRAHVCDSAEALSAHTAHSIAASATSKAIERIPRFFEMYKLTSRVHSLKHVIMTYDDTMDLFTCRAIRTQHGAKRIVYGG